MRLKPGAKVFLALVILVLLGFGAHKLGWLDPVINAVAPAKKQQGTVDRTEFSELNVNADDQQNTPADNNGSDTNQNGDEIAATADTEQPGDKEVVTTPADKGSLGRPIRVGIVLYGGFAGGLMANGGKSANPASVFARDFGVQVELVQIDDLVEMDNAFRIGGDKGGLDMMATTSDMFALQYDQLSDIKPVTILQTDWSRGADAIAVAKGIGNVAQLKGKSISVAEGTPSHFLLLYILSQAGMSSNDVDMKFTTSSIEAAQLFKAGKVDACVSWSPDVYIAASERQGASILASTREATSLLGGTIVARGDFLSRYPKDTANFIRGWMQGVQMCSADPDAAATQLVNAFDGIRMEDAQGMLADVKLAGAPENRQFFELDGDALVGYDDLYNTASKIWKKIGLLNSPTRADLTRNTSFLSDATEVLAGKVEPQTQEFEFDKPTKEEAKAPPVVTKRMTVYFSTGSSTLDENAKQVLEQAAEYAQTFGSARIRVSGNTDSVGGRDMNVELSRKRAQAVVDFMVKKYGFPRDKFVVVGNGPDKPVASNDSEEGRSKNRRTDFEVLPPEQ
ncbi:OmpA family protein [bacterium]|nr:OmpA family protein [bacterium]